MQKLGGKGISEQLQSAVQKIWYDKVIGFAFPIVL